MYNTFFFIMEVCYKFFYFFKFSFFQAKRVNHLEVYVNFQDIEYQLQEKISFVTIIVMKYSSISVVSSNHLKLPEGNFCDIAQTKKMNYIPIFKTWRLLILIMIFYAFLINFCISIKNLTYSSSDILFYH